MKAELYHTLDRLSRLEAGVGISLFALAVVGVAAGGGAVGILTLAAALGAGVLLLAGGLYWRLKRTQLQTQTHFDLRLPQIVYPVALLCLLAYPAVLLVLLFNGTVEQALTDAAVGGIIYLFSIGIFVHHFLVKLVRSDTDQIARTRRRQVTARWMREFVRGEARAKTGKESA